ncbi:ABC transporter permease [Microvirga solisilvae]|uniref:ABC transporter permease n=1 Tax=Microvirga solisilvae TaxID=2919498 RepID=UPI001FAEDDB7|nr:ABC transporter permease [Microvirga solisilvae]
MSSTRIMISSDPVPAQASAAASRGRKIARWMLRNPRIAFGAALFGIILLLTLLAPLLSPYDPLQMNPMNRLKPPSSEHLLGTDALGRDVFTRTLYGGRASLMVGFSVAIAATFIGLCIGLVSGYFRAVDNVLMLVMSGLMSIPGILLAIAMTTLSKASVTTVILAIVVPEVPRTARLVRSIVLTIREQPYVDAAIVTGSSVPRILFRHILPNTAAPLTVQATFICASAIIVEAYLSFLGAGTPPEVPSWGNLIAEARNFIRLAFWILLYPGLLLGLTVLSVNLLGDGLRDLLDPRLARQMKARS